MPNFRILAFRTVGDPDDPKPSWVYRPVLKHAGAQFSICIVYQAADCPTVCELYQCCKMPDMANLPWQLTPNPPRGRAFPARRMLEAVGPLHGADRENRTLRWMWASSVSDADEDIRLGHMRGTLADSCRSSPINTDNGSSLKHSVLGLQFCRRLEASRASHPLNTFAKFRQTSLERFKLGPPHKTKGPNI